MANSLSRLEGVFVVPHPALGARRGLGCDDHMRPKRIMVAHGGGEGHPSHRDCLFPLLKSMMKNSIPSCPDCHAWIDMKSFSRTITKSEAGKVFIINSVAAAATGAAALAIGIYQAGDLKSAVVMSLGSIAGVFAIRSASAALALGKEGVSNVFHRDTKDRRNVHQNKRLGIMSLPPFIDGAERQENAATFASGMAMALALLANVISSAGPKTLAAAGTAVILPIQSFLMHAMAHEENADAGVNQGIIEGAAGTIIGAVAAHSLLPLPLFANEATASMAVNRTLIGQIALAGLTMVKRKISGIDLLSVGAGAVAAAVCDSPLVGALVGGISAVGKLYWKYRV